MKIQDPTPGLSGKYTCKVSTFENEGLVEQQLNIFGKVYLFTFFMIIAKINASILAKLIVTRAIASYYKKCFNSFSSGSNSYNKNMSNIKSIFCFS